jgi:glycyl-tRNA synthetase beta chain
VDRELLLEIGCEELPAGWLPALTNQIGEVVAAELRERRLVPESPIESFSTPRRLTVRVARVPERQTDHEELVTGPPVSAGFAPDGAPTAAAIGFAARQGADVAALERVDTARGSYLAFRRRQRGKAAIDVLPEVLGRSLRRLTFPKVMHWDAQLEDGGGELLFGRPIRWILFVYGGRVVPFTIGRTSAAQTSTVQDVASGAMTYGHRFLTTSGRAGRAIKVRTFEEYRARLLENFVILPRAERHDKIARELDAKALRLKGRISRVVHASGLMHEVPDLVEYPSVIGGTFAPEFLELPEEVLTTTLMFHQHYFPVENESGKLMPAFLAVVNTEPDNERTIARNAERVVTARLRDARFFWETDRRLTLEARIDRLSTLLFHKRLGTYREKAERIERLATWIAREVLGAAPEAVARAGRAARLAKADLTTDMVREFTELQGTMGGIYAREEGAPEEVWKAIYFHYLPIGVEADAPPTRAQLGGAAATWAAVSIADRLDTLVGLFVTGERPTGSRGPDGLRRAAQGVVKILVDQPGPFASASAPDLGELIEQTRANYPGTLRSEDDSWQEALSEFLRERESHIFETRGVRLDEIRAVVPDWWRRPQNALRRIEALAEARRSPEFQMLAVLFKRLKNITREFEQPLTDGARATLVEPAELQLLREFDARWPAIEHALTHERYAEAMRELGALGGPVDRFFRDVLVMTEDAALREARLALLSALKRTILDIADIAEIVPDAQSG